MTTDTLAAMPYSERMAYYAVLIAETAAMLARHRRGGNANRVGLRRRIVRFS